MLNLKCFGRLTAVLLLLCIALTAVVSPVAALPLTVADRIPVTDEADTASRTVSIVHRSASTSSAVIGCLEDGTVLTVLGTYRTCYKIDCYDMTGYIAIDQVSRDDAGEYYVNCQADSSETCQLPVYTATQTLSLRSDIRTTAMQYIGVRYVTGGTTPKGFDCSGFTQYVFAQNGYHLNRTVVDQMPSGIIVSKDDLQCGDLVFFENTTGSGRFASHIGIYIGNGQLIHAGSKGITVVSLEMAYFEYHYLCARRIILSDVSTEAVTPAVSFTQSINSSYWRENTQTGDSGLGSSLSFFL